MFKDIVDTMREGFGTCLKEIKYLSERVEAAEKKVVTNPLPTRD
ncbi:BnaC06g04880D [Brassica napus]|uniref:BnaC06g04880D protein n=1 Tax=Brassica napus TaxID=3708 RepID=A0A078H5K2_BRANA|nr:BnaC06g04880D [Brassica napus]